MKWNEIKTSKKEMKGGLRQRTSTEERVDRQKRERHKAGQSKLDR